ncbi:MAG: type II secretion system F family protein [Kineosporiaceae bacterium]
MTVVPLQLGVLAAATVVVAVVGATLVRDPGPLNSLKVAGADRSRPLDRAVRFLGRPPATLVVGRVRAYRALVSRWLVKSGQGASVPVAVFAERHLGLVVVSLGGLAWLAALEFARFGLVLVLAAAVLPVLQLGSEVRRRQSLMERDMPPFLELMSILLASGLTFRHALSRVSSRLTGPLGEEMRLLLNQLEFGYTPRDAFQDLVERSSAPTVKRVVATVRQNYDLGVPVARALSDIAEDVRAESVVTIKIAAQNAGTRAGLVLVFLTLPAVLGVMLTVLIATAIDTFGQLGV